MPHEGTVLRARTFPYFEDHFGVCFGKGVVTDLGADELFRIVTAA